MLKNSQIGRGSANRYWSFENSSCARTPFYLGLVLCCFLPIPKAWNQKPYLTRFYLKSQSPHIQINSPPQRQTRILFFSPTIILGLCFGKISVPVFRRRVSSSISRWGKSGKYPLASRGLALGYGGTLQYESYGGTLLPKQPVIRFYKPYGQFVKVPLMDLRYNSRVINPPLPGDRRPPLN